MVDRTGQLWEVYAYSAAVDHRVWKLLLVVESKDGQHLCFNLRTGELAPRPETHPWEALHASGGPYRRVEL